MSLRGETFGLPLSQREMEALAAYARHGAYAQIGPDLGCADQTVRNHLSNAYHKLGVNSAIEAFAALGWLILPDPAEVVRVRAGQRLAQIRAELEDIAREVDGCLTELAA